MKRLAERATRLLNCFTAFWGNGMTRPRTAGCQQPCRARALVIGKAHSGPPSRGPTHSKENAGLSQVRKYEGPAVETNRQVMAKMTSTASWLGQGAPARPATSGGGVCLTSPPAASPDGKRALTRDGGGNLKLW